MQAIGTTAHSLLTSTIVPELHATGTVLRRNNLLAIRGNLESILSELPTANAMQCFFFFFSITVQYKARGNLASKLVLWKIGDREVDRFNRCITLYIHCSQIWLNQSESPVSFRKVQLIPLFPQKSKCCGTQVILIHYA